MVLIGDVHGKFEAYKQLLVTLDADESIQLGDMGVGFPGGKILDLSDISGDHKWIRGNHDNPRVSNEHRNYLGEYGLLEGNWTENNYKTMFFISGAWSIDKHWRTPEFDWWEDEELNYNELQRVIDSYKHHKPDIVISHDCPHSVLFELYYGQSAYQNRTGMALDQMFNHWQPKLWVFAHHHVSWQKEINTTKFKCLNELEYYII